jgi:hypothetical protein
MTRVTLRSLLTVVVVAAACVIVGPTPGAAVQDSPLDHFVALAPNVADPQSAGHIEIFIERWSTDEERDQLSDALAQRGPGALLSAIQKLRLRRAGVVLTPGVGGGLGARVRARRARNLLFARRIDTARGRQVILATDRALAFGEPEIAWPSTDEFTLVDIRFGDEGQGTGKVAAAREVLVNKETRTLELANYGTRPVKLTNVRLEQMTRLPMARPSRTSPVPVRPSDGSLR